MCDYNPDNRDLWRDGLRECFKVSVRCSLCVSAICARDSPLREDLNDVKYGIICAQSKSNIST